MKKLLLFVLFIFLLSACGSNNSDSDDSKVDSQSSVRLESRKSKGDGDMVKSIIVYYSLTGNTEAVAEEIHKQVDGELLRIETVESYPEVYDDVLAVVRSQRNLLEHRFGLANLHYQLKNGLVKMICRIKKSILSLRAVVVPSMNRWHGTKTCLIKLTSVKD